MTIASSAPVATDDDDSFQIGRYEIRGDLGRGTMGVVYEAYDPSLRRTIALKTFHLSFAVSPEQYKRFEQRFFTEARIAARLSHPGIVAVHDVGCDAEIGTLYIALEFLKGRTLQEVIKDGVPLDWREALGITRDVAEALHYAHSQGVVHRDIKPANIMLLPSGDPKILDFGIAKMDTRSNLTTACRVFGTPLFMAPEQALGRTPDGRADLFSLGAIAYTLLTGRLAFEAPSIPATVRRVVKDDPQPPSQIIPDLPRGVDEVIARALAKSPEHRYASGHEMVEDIQALLVSDRIRGGKVAAESAGDAPSTDGPTARDGAVPPLPARSAHVVLDLDAELAALVSSPAAPTDSVRAASPRRTSRSLRLVLPAVLAVLSVGYLALRGPSPAVVVPTAPTPAAEVPAGPTPAAERPAVPGPPPAAPLAPPSAPARPASQPVGPANTPNNRRSLGEPVRQKRVPVPLQSQSSAPGGPGEGRPTAVPSAAAAVESPSGAPSQPEGLASKANDSLSVGEPARLRIDFEHPLKSGTLRLWIGDEMVLQQELEGRDTTKVLNLRKGRFDREIAVKPGEHTVRAQVRWDGNEREQRLSGRFKAGAVRQLEMNLGRFRKNFSAEWK